MRMHPARFKRLSSIFDAGETACVHFPAKLISPDRFNRQEEFASYLGLAPVISPARARLRQVGQKRLRDILVEAE